MGIASLNPQNWGMNPVTDKLPLQRGVDGYCKSQSTELGDKPSDRQASLTEGS